MALFPGVYAHAAPAKADAGYDKAIGFAGEHKLKRPMEQAK